MLLTLLMPFAAGVSQLGQAFLIAQEGRPEVTLDLGMGQGAPGASVIIPANLKIARDIRVGAISMEVFFPGGLVSFQEVRKAIGAEAAEAEVTSSVESLEAEGERSLVRISVTAQNGMWLSSGNMVDLVFKVDEEAPLKAVATLEPRLRATTAGGDLNPIAATEVDDGEIMVDKTTLVFSCFFYMH